MRRIAIAYESVRLFRYIISGYLCQTVDIIVVRIGGQPAVAVIIVLVYYLFKRVGILVVYSSVSVYIKLGRV